MASPSQPQQSRNRGNNAFDIALIGNSAEFSRRRTGQALLLSGMKDKRQRQETSSGNFFMCKNAHWHFLLGA
jgi:hypothetical protein